MDDDDEVMPDLVDAGALRHLADVALASRAIDTIVTLPPMRCSPDSDDGSSGTH